eukprot:1450370-Rhodomonas_salina.1
MGHGPPTPCNVVPDTVWLPRRLIRRTTASHTRRPLRCTAYDLSTGLCIAYRLYWYRILTRAMLLPGVTLFNTKDPVSERLWSFGQSQVRLSCAVPVPIIA